MQEEAGPWGREKELFAQIVDSPSFPAELLLLASWCPLEQIRPGTETEEWLEARRLSTTSSLLLIAQMQTPSSTSSSSNRKARFVPIVRPHFKLDY